MAVLGHATRLEIATLVGFRIILLGANAIGNTASIVGYVGIVCFRIILFRTKAVGNTVSIIVCASSILHSNVLSRWHQKIQPMAFSSRG